MPGLTGVGVTDFTSTSLSNPDGHDVVSYAVVTLKSFQASPFEATAQHCRAMRLAMATSATFLGFFARMADTHGVLYLPLATA